MVLPGDWGDVTTAMEDVGVGSMVGAAVVVGGGEVDVSGVEEGSDV